VAAYCFVRS